MNDPGLLWPPALWLLLFVPLLIVSFLRSRRKKAKAYLSYPGAGFLTGLARRWRPWKGLPAFLYLSAITLGMFALARPTLKLLTPDDLSGVMLAIETSRSMGSPDIPPSRLAATQAAAKALVAAVPRTIKVGVTTFSGYGALNVPLTRDHARVSEGIDALSIGGSFAFTDGLITALAELPEEDPEEGLPGAIVLFSHGHDNSLNDPLAIADEAAARGIKIHTVGVGTHGNNFSEDILQQVAERTGGEYYPIFNASDLQNAHRDLGQVITLRPKTTEVTALPALLAALLLFVSLSLADWRRLL